MGKCLRSSVRTWKKAGYLVEDSAGRFHYCYVHHGVERIEGHLMITLGIVGFAGFTVNCRVRG